MLLEIKHLQKSFGGVQAVKDVSLKVDSGHIVSIIGPNGAGKTTIFNLISGIYKADAGEIIFNGEDIVGKPQHEIALKGVSRTFQNIRLFSNLPVIDNVKAALHNHYKYGLIHGIFRTPLYYKTEKAMDEKAMEILKVFELDGVADYKASQLPYGRQRKLEIARAIATEPKLLLLDEPAAGMNPQETHELMETIKFVRDNFHTTILLIEHDMKLVSGICEKLTVLNFGRVLKQGETYDVLHDAEVIKAYLGD